MLRRLFDIVVSAVILLFTTPVLLITAILVSTDGGPVLYRQTRAGRGGRAFSIVKIRSMRPNRFTTAELISAHGQVDGLHPEVTAVGQWIRRFKVDELPQLINVLLGDMSLIGPRPTVMEQVEEYTPYQLRRLEVRPGLSGWAQVNGGIELSWPERILLDVWYIDNRSLWLDVSILWRTALVVFFGENRNISALHSAELHARQKLGVNDLVWPQQPT
jgi:lipopolysaccharide/colanic/teichoic acid biosynthesis glycosyltransferase